MSSHVITRFPPSPTGFKHIGNYRTALFAYLFAKQNDGSFILRIEDTDKARSEKKYEQHIYDTLEWLKIPYEKVFVQSEHIESHKKYLKKLIDEDKAYVSSEEAKDGSGKINDLVRFRNQKEKITFDDMIRGPIEIDTTDLGDFIIAKNMDEPLFHIAVVVDDFEEGVTHVIRGEDHISNTPRQILLQKAIGAPTPKYAHLALLLSGDRSKMASRKGAVTPLYYRDRGYLPEAMINCMALLGWHPSDDQEILSMDELLQKFDLSKVQKASAIFDEVKLNWINREYMMKIPIDEYCGIARTFVSTRLSSLPNFDEVFEKALQNVRERISYFGEIKVIEEAGDLDYLFIDPSYETSSLLCAPKMRKGKEDLMLADLRPLLEKVSALLSEIDASEWSAALIKDTVWPYTEEAGRGIVLWAYRVALSGKEKSPDPFTLSYIIGKNETISRLNKAATSLQQAHNDKSK